MQAEDIAKLTRLQLFKLGAKIVGESIWTRGRNFIYIPRTYDSNPEYAKWQQQVEQIAYTFAGKKMTAWLDSDPEKPPQRIWLLFGGNAAVALDWLPVTSFAPASPDAFVLVDYPGYGNCEGKPTRATIRKAIDELINNLCNRYSINTEEMSKQFRVMGYSLGAAIALDTAARHGIHKGVLIAPFTSVRATGALMFPKFLTYLAADPYDNLESLSLISKNKDDQTHFHIVHGELDIQLPISMSQELNDQFPDITTLWPIPEADHNDVMLKQSDALAKALTNGGDFSQEPIT